jgi:copper transport protein
MRLAHRVGWIAVFGALLAVVSASPAAAHTGLDASDPADGATVAGPLDVVVLDFTGTPTAIDDGIAVADEAGTRIEPVEISQDGLRITARFEPPLTGGSYALSWIVRSDDTHTIDGSFTFAVTVPPTTIPPTTTPETPTTETPTTAAPSTAAPSTVAPSTVAPATTLEDAERAEDEPGSTADDEVVPLPVTPPRPPSVASEVDEGESVARIGRLMLFPATVVALGTLAFAAFAFAGRRDDLASLLHLGRWLGFVIALGALLEVVGLSAVFDGYGDLLDTASGRASAARVLAGLLLVVGIGAGAGGVGRSLSAAVVGEQTGAHPAVRAEGPWRPGLRDLGGLIGAAMLTVSFAFGGHTASEGPRLVHAVASVAHVAAVSMWAGGLVAIAIILWRRARDGVATSAVAMVLRFSVVAMVSLAVAGAAGVLMAWFIQSDLGAYLSTEWGRMMLLKLVLVAAAAALGAYNHFRLLPELEAAPDDSDVIARTRSTVTVEAGLLVVVALVTAILVGASTI